MEPLDYQETKQRIQRDVRRLLKQLERERGFTSPVRDDDEGAGGTVVLRNPRPKKVLVYGKPGGRPFYDKLAARGCSLAYANSLQPAIDALKHERFEFVILEKSLQGEDFAMAAKGDKRAFKGATMAVLWKRYGYVPFLVLPGTADSTFLLVVTRDITFKGNASTIALEDLVLSLDLSAHVPASD